VELDIFILHDRSFTPTLRYGLQFAEGVLDRATIDAERDESETPGTKEVLQGYDRHVGSRRDRTNVWD
jgi:hypothetical protein